MNKNIHKSSSIRKKLTYLILIFLLLAISYFIFISESYLYPGAFRHPFSLSTSKLPNNAAQLYLNSDGAKLRVWHFSKPLNSTTVLIFSGDDGDVTFLESFCQLLLVNGINSIIFDYRGFGGSSGFPSENGITSDVKAVSKYLTDINTDHKAILGVSFGTYPALLSSTFVDVDALIEVSPYLDFPSVDRRLFSYPWIVDYFWPQYSNTKLINSSKINAKSIHIFHGDSDPEILIDNSIELNRILSLKNYPTNFRILKEVGHITALAEASPEIINILKKLKTD